MPNYTKPSIVVLRPTPLPDKSNPARVSWNTARTARTAPQVDAQGR